MSKSVLPAALALAIGLAPLVRAEPFDGKQVSAEAKWWVHIDVDAIKAGEVPQAIGALWLTPPAGVEHLKGIGNVVGLDPTEDLHGITISGRRYSQPAAVVIVRAKVDRKRLMAFLRTRPGYRTDSYGKHELVAWTERQGKEDEHSVTGCFHQPTVIVFGRDAAEVRQALDVLDGTSPGLAEHDPLSGAHAPPGTMIQACGVDLAEVELPFKSPLVRKSRVFSVALGEHDGEAFAVATAATQSAEITGQLRAVVEGFLAMAGLQLDTDEEATRLLEAVKVSSDEKAVWVQFRGPPQDVSKLIKKAWTKQLRPK